MEGSSFILYNSNMHAPRQKPAIQVFNLFGESGDLPDVVHCETIAARSVLHDWVFAAHRHARLHQVLLIESGSGQATLEGRVHALKPMSVVNVPVGHVHGYSFEPGTQGWVLTLAAEILDETLLAPEGLRGVLSQSAALRGTPQIRATMKQIFAEYAGRNFGRAHILRALSAAQIGFWRASSSTADRKAAPPIPTCSAALKRNWNSIIWSAGAYPITPRRCR